MKKRKMMEAFLQEMPWLINCMRTLVDVPKDADEAATKSHVIDWMTCNIEWMGKRQFTFNDYNRHKFYEIAHNAVSFEGKSFSPFLRRWFVLVFEENGCDSPYTVREDRTPDELTIGKLINREGQKRKKEPIAVVEVETSGILCSCSSIRITALTL